MSQILALPRLTFPVTVYNNENWTDSWGYFDSTTGAGVSGAGVDLYLMMRLTPDDTKPLIVASTVQGPVNGIQQNGKIAWGGAAGNLILPNIPVETIEKIKVGGPYYAEVLGVSDGYRRVLAEIAFTVALGIVR